MTASPCSAPRSEEHTSEFQSPCNLVCRLLLEKKPHDQNDRSVLNTTYRQAGPGTPARPRELRRSGVPAVRRLPARRRPPRPCLFFFFNDTSTTEIYTLSLHDALPI